MMKMEGMRNGRGSKHFVGFPIQKLCAASGQTSKRDSSGKEASRMYMTFLPILVHIFLENTKLYNKKPI